MSTSTRCWSGLPPRAADATPRLTLKQAAATADPLPMPRRAGTPDRREALTAAGRLAAGGDDYAALGGSLVSALGRDERPARAPTGGAFRPRPAVHQTLRAELEAIARKLDAARRDS